MKHTMLFLLSCSILFVIACEKGPIGPEGPQGPQGTQGAQGPQGPQGNANVKRYSYNMPLKDFNRYSSTNEYWDYKTISTSIDDDAAVLGFLYSNHASSSGTYMALPMVDYWNTGDCFNAHNYSLASSNRIKHSIRNSCGGAPYSNMSTGSLSYRVFVIRAYGKNALDGVDITNYEAVNTALGFKD